MAKRLTYADALRTLGQNDSEVLDLAEKLADGGLGLMGVPDLFGARGLLVSKGRQAIEGIRDRLRGQSRLSRTERIEAAHRILVLVAFFEALEGAWEKAEAPFPLTELEITAEEQLSWFAPLLSGSSSASPPLMPVTPDTEDRATPTPAAFSLLFSAMAETFVGTVPGFAVAETHGITSREHPFLRRVTELAVVLSAARYEEHYRRLAAEIPEFGMWVHLDEHRRTRRDLSEGLGELHRLLEQVGSRRPVDRRRQELSASYRAVLRQPVLRSDDAPPGLALPTLEEAYVPPRGRVMSAHPHSSPAAEETWAEALAFADLQSFVAAHLVHPRATALPTVVLGHPGAGKSKFTEMLAARLPAPDFLPIRVELRAVRPNSPIHLQIEEGLAATLHTQVPWRELAESADGALPVIILDGFDELLQATGVDRSDYLERVQEFQQQQEALGRPVVVIVTSRTVVADRTRFPDGTTVIRLDPFDEAQIDRMLQVWNGANTRAFTARGLEPLTTDVLMRYRELAEQPLLLLMLLVYDAGDNGLRRASKALTHGQLYERLLTMFAKREVDKHHSFLNRHDLEEAIEGELRRLEIAALAMFTRRKQSVGADELDRDLAVLMPEAALRPSDTDLHGRIAPAHQVLGRFFFVHEARAKVADGDASVFEFLHATFGEYLVARAVVAVLDDLDESRSRSYRRRGRAAARVDDGELYALSSFACYSGREKVVDFLAELLERRFEEEPEAREDYGRLLVELFQEAPFPAANRSYTDYEPVRLPLTLREANYTGNLMILLCLVREEPVEARELFPDTDEPDQKLQRTSTLWRTLPGSEWFGLLTTLRVRHLDGWGEDGPITVIEREDGSPVNVGECLGFELRMNQGHDLDVTDPYEVTVPYESVTSRLLRSMSLRVNGTAARFLLGMLPYLRHVGDDLATWYSDSSIPGEGTIWSEVHEVMRLRMEPPGHDPRGRLLGYRRLLFPSGRVLGRRELLVLKQAVEDLSLSTDDDFKERLRDAVGAYLSQVEEVVTGPQLAPTTVAPVLHALWPHMRDSVKHLLALVHGGEALASPIADTASSSSPRTAASPSSSPFSSPSNSPSSSPFSSGGSCGG
ncbi:hypothetical protein [Nocardiopsis sp. ATB16-24]|uniref:NACHT domain-containing protein n=1 Tax=Nocardiopsis sp. ATB16-24 TaxID=3019555 RepID=UPI00255590B1|nr:hypothetical protein [Nocardiopsis sp. ATB16-24]